jgi:outer membrane biosynthesis protein TonB
LPEDASTADVSTASVDASLTPVEAAAPSVEASIPTPSPPDMTSAPAYPPSALLETFSNAKAKLIACYEPGRKRNPKLRGKVIVKLTINTDGSAKPVVNQNSNLEDPEVIACVIRTVKSLRFPKPVEGSVTVTYPFIFRPTGDETLILPEAGKQ